MKHNQELTAPFIIKQAERQIAMAPVLVPNEPDSDGDVVTAEKIEQVAIEFMLKYQNIDVQHSLNNVGKVVFSEITRRDETFNIQGEPVIIRKGTWLLGVHVDDAEVWGNIKSGKLAGMSLMAVPQIVMKSLQTHSISQKDFDEASKRVTLADLEKAGDWIVNAVSIVDNPAVPKAKWVALKSAEKCGAEPPVGSFDYIRVKVREALEERFQVPVWVKHLFSDNAIFSISSEDVELSDKSFRVSYVFTADKELVTLIGEPEEVKLETVIVPKRTEREWETLLSIAEKVNPERLENLKAQIQEADIVITKNPAYLFHYFSKKQLDDGLTPEEQEGLATLFYHKAFNAFPNVRESLLSKIGKSLFGGSSEKESMTFSSTNFSKMKDARNKLKEFMGILDDLISVGEAERERKGKKSQEGGQEEMTKEKFKEMLKETLTEDSEFREAVKSQLAEIEAQGGEGKGEGEGKETGTETQTQEGGEAGAGEGEGNGGENGDTQDSASKAEIESLKTEVSSLKTSLETVSGDLKEIVDAIKGKKVITSSRALKGEGDEKAVIKSDVDGMGYKAHHYQGMNGGK